jgi:polyketide cyclase/dehydrase/lipid transport protein
VPDIYRRHALICAPIEDVWSVVSDPRTHPEWWPAIDEVEVPDDLDAAGGEYVRRVRVMPFLSMVDAVWVKEPVEQLREVNFRCTVTGSYMRFSLTPAQDETFVQLESGILPIGRQGRIARRISPLYVPRWLRKLMDALPGVVAERR